MDRHPLTRWVDALRPRRFFMVEVVELGSAGIFLSWAMAVAAIASTRGLLRRNGSGDDSFYYRSPPVSWQANGGTLQWTLLLEKASLSAHQCGRPMRIFAIKDHSAH
jgi:hypothetical protein